jgi:hypothetical protein
LARTSLAGMPQDFRSVRASFSLSCNHLFRFLTLILSLPWPWHFLYTSPVDAATDAMWAELEKIAAELDPEALKRFTANLRAGDLINFDRAAADAATEQAGLRKAMLTGGIKRLSKSPQHHTAMYMGLDPETGKHMLGHNFEQGGRTGVSLAPLDEFANNSSYHAYRPAGVTPEQGQAAADEIRRLSQVPTEYSKRNLVAAGVAEAAGEGDTVMSRAGRGLAKRLSKVCDPGTGICSHLPVDAYSPGMGREEAVKVFGGGNVPVDEAHFRVTPKTISQSPHMKGLGTYQPMAQESSTVKAVGKGLFKSLKTKMAPSLGTAVRALTPG